MTTIAFDGRFLAVDTQRTCGGAATSMREEKLFTFYSVYFARDIHMAAGGSVSTILAVKRWLELGGDMPNFSSDNFDGMVVDIDGKNAAELVDGGIFQPIRGSWVGGSGYLIALTALHLGFNPMDAVRAAIDLDIHTGGDVVWVELKGDQDGSARLGSKGKLPVS